MKKQISRGMQKVHRVVRQMIGWINIHTNPISSKCDGVDGFGQIRVDIKKKKPPPPPYSRRSLVDFRDRVEHYGAGLARLLSGGGE